MGGMQWNMNKAERNLCPLKNQIRWKCNITFESINLIFFKFIIDI